MVSISIPFNSSICFNIFVKNRSIMVAHKSISDLCSSTMFNETEILNMVWTCAADVVERMEFARKED